MRIIGVTELWPKLTEYSWTTFRFARKDRDWEVGEVVQVVYKPRSKERAILGIAEIVGKDPRWVIEPQLNHLLIGALRQHPEWDDIHFVSENEAKRDGFEDRDQMIRWIANSQTQGLSRSLLEPMNKLRLRWKQAWLNLPGSQAPDTMRKWAAMQNKINKLPTT